MQKPDFERCPPVSIGDIVDMSRWNNSPLTSVDEAVGDECRVTWVYHRTHSQTGVCVDVIDTQGRTVKGIDRAWTLPVSDATTD